MNNISITISTKDNQTQAFGYDPKFYADENARNIDIANDMTRAKERFGDKVAIVQVTEWSNNDKIKIERGAAYASIDDALKIYGNAEIDVDALDKATKE